MTAPHHFGRRAPAQVAAVRQRMDLSDLMVAALDSVGLTTATRLAGFVALAIIVALKFA